MIKKNDYKSKWPRDRWLILTALILVTITIWNSRFVLFPRSVNHWPSDDWVYLKPEVLGVDSDMLQDMIDDIMGSGFAVDSVLVVKDGYLVTEWYFNDYGNDILHNVYSCTKSVVSTLVGIAIDKGSRRLGGRHL